MKSIPAEQIVESLSEDLQDLVVREAFVRQRKGALAAALGERRKQEAALKEKKPGMFGGKGAKEEHDAALVRARGEIVAEEKALADCDLILNKTGRIIETELENFFQTKSEDYRKALAAQKLVPEWERAVTLYLVSLKQFIMKLGIARNQMASGYDRKTGKFAAGSLEAFAATTTAAKSLETEAAIPNQIAKRQREGLGVDASPNAPVPPNSAALPYLGSLGLAKQVAGLATLTLEAAQTTIGALIDQAEKLHQEEIPGLLEGIARERAGEEAGQKNHLNRAMGDIRAMADGLVDPAQMEAVWASMEARFVTLTG